MQFLDFWIQILTPRHPPAEKGNPSARSAAGAVRHNRGSQESPAGKNGKLGSNGAQRGPSSSGEKATPKNSKKRRKGKPGSGISRANGMDIPASGSVCNGATCRLHVSPPLPLPLAQRSLPPPLHSPLKATRGPEHHTPPLPSHGQRTLKTARGHNTPKNTTKGKTEEATKPTPQLPAMAEEMIYGMGGRRPTYRSLDTLSPRFFCEPETYEEPQHFLDRCFLCKKHLGGNRDIFMYRGNTPFCSEECREEQIDIDEASDRSWSKYPAKQKQRKAKLADIRVRATGTVVAG